MILDKDRMERLYTATGDSALQRAEALREDVDDDAFASFLLNDKGPPSLKEDMLVILFALEKRQEATNPFVRESLLLPVYWKEGEHSPLLPQRLRDLADRVLKNGELLALSEKTGDNSVRWGLQPWFSSVDISDWDEFATTWESAWGILAAGLYLKRNNLRFMPRVFVSAAWNEKTIQGVDSVGEKAREAKAVGASCLFIATETPDAKATLHQLEDNNFVIKYFPHKNLGLGASLSDLLLVLDAEPPPDAPIAQRREYAVRWARFKSTSTEEEKRFDEYCFEKLVPAKAAELRYGSEIGNIDSLVVLVSRLSPARLSMETFTPSRALFLINNLKEEAFNQFFQNLPITFKKVDIENPTEIQKVISDWLGCAGGNIVVDVTGMPKIAAAAATLAAAEAGAAVVAMQTNNSEAGGGYIPGAEKLIWIGKRSNA